MLKKTLFSLAFLALALSTVLPAAATESSAVGQIVKVTDRPTLYYVAADGKKYIFPNEKIFRTWFSGFKNVVTVSVEELATVPLGGNVLYRPGIVLVKSTDNPNVFAVSKDGVLRWLKNEVVAKHLYGDNWNKLVDDLPGSLISQYKVGAPIDNDDDYDADSEANDTQTIDENHGLKLGQIHQIAETVRCRVIEKVAEKFDEKHQRVGPFEKILERFCDKSNNNDFTAPTILNITSTASTTSAVINWNTNESSNSRVRYSNEHLATASSTNSVLDTTLVTVHSLQLSSLNASSTYYFLVESTDSNGNMATSSEQMFATL
ncbi:MAG: fibronectin type III domain-containing protein [Patescibacteria group bacterium]|nr:fibronectin type III domain-containing protein [Patescibacteria group bacterium]